MSFPSASVESRDDAKKRTLMYCPERERLESALAEVLSRRDYLSKLSCDDPDFGQLKQEIEKLSLKVDQAHRALPTHGDEHGS